MTAPKRILSALAGFVALAISSQALAQWATQPRTEKLPSWDRDRGIRAGQFRFWPKLTVETGWDSNVFRASEGEAALDAVLLRVRPGLLIANPQYNRLRLVLDAEADARFYFGTGDDPAAEAAEEQRNVGARLGFAVDILPRGPVTIQLFDQFRRALETRTYASSKNYNRNFNRAGAAVGVHPGGGALDFTVGYAYAFDRYDQWSAGDGSYHEVDAGFRWRFFPKTSLVIDGSWFHLVYAHPNYGSGTPGVDANVNINSQPLRVYAGIEGNITPSFTLLAKLGYGGTFHESGPSANTVLASVRAAYRFAAKALLQLGYERTVFDSYYANYYTDDNPFFGVQWRPVRWLDLRARVGYHHYAFAPFDFRTAGVDHVAGNGDDIVPRPSERVDHGFDTTLQVEFDAWRFLGVTLAYQLEGRSSDFELRQFDGTVVDRVDFLRHILSVAVTARY